MSIEHIYNYLQKQIYFSEPHSILAPEATPMAMEELERMIQEKIAEQQPATEDRSKTQQQPQR